MMVFLGIIGVLLMLILFFYVEPENALIIILFLSFGLSLYFKNVDKKEEIPNFSNELILNQVKIDKI